MNDKLVTELQRPEQVSKVFKWEFSEQVERLQGITDSPLPAYFLTLVCYLSVIILEYQFIDFYLL